MRVMICVNCKKDKLVNDFIKNENICYKCVFQKKLENSVQFRNVKPMNCRSCGKKIFHKENVKKRQRTIFCSLECAQQGHRDQTNNHWTRKIKGFT